MYLLTHILQLILYYFQLYLIKIMIRTNSRSLSNFTFKKIPGKNDYSELSLAMKDTCVYFIFSNNKKRSNMYQDIQLVHCDFGGKIINQYAVQSTKLQLSSFPLLMLSQYQVLTCEILNNKLVLINLKTSQLIKFHHTFRAKDSSHIQIIKFDDSNFICLLQTICINEFKITYYALPLSTNKPFAVYSYNTQYKIELKIQKANNHSMIVWYEQKVEDQFILNCYDLRSFPQGGYLEIFDLQKAFFNQIYKSTSITVNNVWERKTGELYLQLKYQQSSSLKIIKIIRIDINDRHQNKFFQIKYIIPQSFQCSSINLGQYYFLFMESKFIKQKIYIYESTLNSNGQERTIQIKGYDYNQPTSLELISPICHRQTIYWFQYPKEEQDKKITQSVVSVKSIQIYNLRLFILQFLLHIKQDFDDDFLNDAVNIIDFDNQEMMKYFQVSANSEKAFYE